MVEEKRVGREEFSFLLLEGVGSCVSVFWRRNLEIKYAIAFYVIVFS